jgi:hypothetical protein
MLQCVQVDQAATGFSRCQAVGIAWLVFERAPSRLEHPPILRGVGIGRQVRREIYAAETKLVWFSAVFKHGTSCIHRLEKAKLPLFQATSGAFGGGMADGNDLKNAPEGQGFPRGANYFIRTADDANVIRLSAWCGEPHSILTSILNKGLV